MVLFVKEDPVNSSVELEYASVAPPKPKAAVCVPDDAISPLPVAIGVVVVQDVPFHNSVAAAPGPGPPPKPMAAV